MSDNNVPVVDKGDTGMATIVYWLYIASYLVGFTSIVGVIMAYVARGDAPAWLQSHYQFQIRSFWLLFLFSVISILLTFVFIGFLTGLLTAIWFLVRCIKGITWLGRGEEVPNPTSWMFGDAPK